MKNPEIEVKPGKILFVYSKKKTSEIENKWIDVFCKNKQGANIKTYKWHIFSFEKYPAKDGTKALEEYFSRKSPEYIVLSNEGDLAIETDRLPEESNLSDYYVFPKNFAWTMAFTHEDGWLGPYFAKHKNYDLLNVNNEKTLRELKTKKIQIKIAKEKGWI